MSKQKMFALIFKYIIYVFSIICTSYLLYVDIYLFLSKPTYSSDSEQKLQPKNFPNILLCPFPSFDLFQLQKHGYSEGYEYCKGNIQGSMSRGWCGNATESVEEVIQNIALLKSTNDCPKMKAFFEKDINIDWIDWKDEKVDFEMTKLLHPHGRCCQAKIPPKAKKSHVIKECFPL